MERLAEADCRRAVPNAAVSEWAIHGNADIGEDTAEAYVQLGYNGTATIFLCVAEFGTGQKSNYIKMAAEVLQIPPERIEMSPADTLVTPYEFGPVGSRGTYAIGSAVINAAEDAKRKLLEMAAPKLGADPEDLDTADGVIFVKGPAGQGNQVAMSWATTGPFSATDGLNPISRCAIA